MAKFIILMDSKLDILVNNVTSNTHSHLKIKKKDWIKITEADE